MAQGQKFAWRERFQASRRDAGDLDVHLRPLKPTVTGTDSLRD